MKNEWKDCIQSPPPEYVRVEIKTKDLEKIPGYRYRHEYYKTFGNSIITNPDKWRYIPMESSLYKYIKRKLVDEIKSEVVAYDTSN